MKEFECAICKLILPYESKSDLNEKKEHVYGCFKF